MRFALALAGLLALSGTSVFAQDNKPEKSGDILSGIFADDVPGEEGTLFLPGNGGRMPFFFNQNFSVVRLGSFVAYPGMRGSSFAGPGWSIGNMKNFRMGNFNFPLRFR
jgi:hypothetical protein